MAKLNDVLKSLRKKNNSTTLAETSIGKVTEYISTGSFALNRVITGDINKGIPQGRICTLYGQSGSGKSLIATQIVKNALENNQVDRVWVLDSEGGIQGLFKSFNINEELVEYIPVSDIEEATIKLITIYDTLVQAREEYLKDPENNDNIRGLVILDSFGGLVSGKVITDATDKGKMVQDMGESAKKRNSLMRSIMMRVVKSNVALICVNHSYDDPAAMFTSKIKNMAGGHGIEYASHVIIQCQKLLVKSDNNDYLTGNEQNNVRSDVGYMKGNKLTFFVVKSRVSKPCFSATVYVDFDHGIAKWDGLIEDAIKYGYIEEVRGGYLVKSYSDKKVTYKELISNDKIWETFIDDFNKKSIEEMQYSNSNTAKIEEIEKEIEGIDNSEQLQNTIDEVID